MKFRLFAGCATFGLTGTLGLTLAGCGGGGSAITAPGAATRAALTGAAMAPQSQTRSASRVDAAVDPLVAVSGATVTLFNLDDTTTANGFVGTTTTGSDGSYSFPTVVAGANYKVEAVKVIGTKTLTLDAVVTAPAPPADGTAAPAPVPHDLTPNTTVAAVAVIAQVAALKAADPTSKHTNLQALSDDLVKKRVADNTPPPDCTNPAAVTSDANTLRQATAPKGSYTGVAITTAVSVGNTNQKVGDATRLAAQIDASGHFFLVAIGQASKTTAAATTGTGTSGNGGNSGSGNSGNGGNGNQGGGNGGFAVGSVTADGIVNATSKDGSIKIVGIFTSGAATGTFKSVDGSQSGTWTLTLLKSAYAGLYAGKYVTLNPGDSTGGAGSGSGSGTGSGSGSGTGSGTGSGSGSGTGGGSGTGSGGSGSGGLTLGITSNGVKGDFALLVLDDNTAIILGSDSGTSVSGTGAVSATGAVTFTVKDSSGNTVTGTGQIDVTAHTVSGTFNTGSTETGQFEGRSDHADTTDL